MFLGWLQWVFIGFEGVDGGGGDDGGGGYGRNRRREGVVLAVDLRGLFR